MAQIYNVISIVAFSLAGVTLAAAVFFWIKFSIPKVIGDLSGRTAKKSIEQMRAENEKSGKKSYRPSPVAANRGSLTEEIEHSKKLGKSKTVAPKAQKNSGEVSQVSKNDNATVLLHYDSGGTELLGDSTEVLKPIVGQGLPAQNVEAFEPVQSTVLIHTDEVI